MVENSDRSRSEINQIFNAQIPMYWGEQPIVSGPTYVGVVMIFLMVLGLVYVKDRRKWVLFFVAVLALMLSWGKNFAPGKQYKNVKTNTQLQQQEFYGKKFLVNDVLQPIEWSLDSETKKIGNYSCFKATASIPTDELTWYSFTWDKLRNTAESDSSEVKEVKMTQVEAWYTLQIPVRHGPLEYWGLPGLILEITAGDTTMLCSKIVINPQGKIKIEAPDKGKEITKSAYQATISGKMQEMRDNRGRRN